MVEGYLESGERPLEGKLIAVLDDDVYATRLLQTSFEALGATVRVQHDQDRFLNMLNSWWDSGSSGPDLMVLDFFLESGTVIPVWKEVLERFKDSPPPAVLLTNALWQNDMSMLTVSMPFLTKPLTSAHMTALVAALVDGSQRSFTHRFQMYETSVSVKTSR
jgi:DNA-binding response OmpR family regulator